MRRCTVLWLALAASAAAALPEVAIDPQNLLAPDAPEWRPWAEEIARQPDLVAEFVERRHFPFRKEPVVLAGEVRVSRARGLSLHYTAPERRIVILDSQGVLVRDAAGQSAPPDPRAAAANAALLHILRFDLAALAREFELYGRREQEAWSLALVPRVAALRRAIGNIHVGGAGPAVRTIELRRSAKQHIDIEISASRAATFSPEEIQRYFR